MSDASEISKGFQNALGTKGINQAVSNVSTPTSPAKAEQQSDASLAMARRLAKLQQTGTSNE